MRRRGYGGRWLAGMVVGLGGVALLAAAPALPGGDAAERTAPEGEAAEWRVVAAVSPDRVESPVVPVSRAAAAPKEGAPVEAESVLELQEGSASYYASMLAGRPTASGVPYDPSAAVAAHRKLPFGTRLRVHNLANGRSVEVEVVDRGPFAKGRILDLSRSAARKLDFLREGHTRVRIEVLEYGDGRGR